ncbi:MAG: biliverdin-producing heme oxygenase [Flavisolibacter sp.]|jgi:heme oxygenase
MPLIIDSVAQVIKAHTSDSHALAEKSLLLRLEAIRCKADYAAILKMFYGFFFPVQQKILTHISPDHLKDIEERRLASLILDDLQSINFPSQHITLCSELPEIKSAAQAFGALYVLEGATLGGRIIAKMLLRNSHLQLSEENLSFFNGYKEATGIKWKIFQQALNQQFGQELLVDTAKETFLLFRNWINTCWPHEHTSEKEC